MKHCLPGIRTVVEDRAISGGDAAFGRDLRGDEVQVADHRLVACSGFGERSEMLARDNQDVRGRLRIQILERHGLFVLMDKARRNLPGDDFTEDAIGHARIIA